MIQEVLILRTVLLVTVDEAFDETEKGERVKEREFTKWMKMQLQKLNHQ